MKRIAVVEDEVYMREELCDMLQKDSYQMCIRDRFSITEGNAWMSTLTNSVQYISVIRPGEKVAKLVKRMHYVSFVGMFRSDIFEGLCVGCLLYTLDVYKRQPQILFHHLQQKL